MEPQHVPSALAALPELRVSSTTTSAEAAAAIRALADFNGCMVGIVRFSGQTPWERHPGDEMLYVVDGAVDVTVMFDDGAQHTTLTTGSVFVVPSGRWHRQEPRPLVSLMFVTPAAGTDASWSDDPRHDERQPPGQPPTNDVRTA
jgi:mannose-6-phosphate isomerase-like protein (cupin superfamily)